MTRFQPHAFQDHPGNHSLLLQNRFWFVFIVLLQVAACIALAVFPTEKSLPFIAVLVLLMISVFSVRTTLLLLVFILILVPIRYYRYPSIPFSITTEMYVAGFLLLIFYFVLQRLKTGTITYRQSSLNLPLALFLGVVWLAALSGVVRGHSGLSVLNEVFLLSFYATFWIVLNMSDPERITRMLFPVLTVLMVIVLAEYFYVALREPHLIAMKGGRIITRQANMAVVVFPYLATLFWFAPSLKKKIGYLVALSIPLTVAALQGQRALWIAMLVGGVYVAAYVFVKKRHLFFKNALFGVVGVVLLLVVIVNYELGFFQKLAGVEMKEVVGARFQTFERVGVDPSLLIRVADLNAVFGEIKKNPILGAGLGATVFRRIGRVDISYLDNSFVYLFWKTGVIGLGCFLWFIAVVLRKCFHILSRSKDDEVVATTLSITAGLFGLLILSMFSVTLVAYRFTLIWATMVAVVEFMWLRARAETDA
jgi:hypothetical protein